MLVDLIHFIINHKYCSINDYIYHGEQMVKGYQFFYYLIAFDIDKN